eukprot:3954869-Lingulodinium_polyedra.AAC.1
MAIRSRGRGAPGAGRPNRADRARTHRRTWIAARGGRGRHLRRWGGTTGKSLQPLPTCER